MSSDGAVKKIYKSLNHKSKEQMYYVYRNAGKLTEETKKMIDTVGDKCEICKKNVHSRSRPSVAVPIAMYFNTVVAIDAASGQVVSEISEGLDGCNYLIECHKERNWLVLGNARGPGDLLIYTASKKE